MLSAAGLSFACQYNEKTHVLTECEEYIKGSEEIKDECRKAHSAYNKYVAAKVAKKAQQKATRIQNFWALFFKKRFVLSSYIIYYYRN
ncbi:MAG: hypothetical protein II367_02025 [Treponema sp.]|nr:hypothetical protein [Treponema sp.]